jgi:hypothetical protein
MTNRWIEMLPGVLENTLQNFVRDVEEAHSTGRELPSPPPTVDGDIPLQIVTKLEPGQEMGQIGAKIIVGRELWLWSIKRALEGTAQVLHRHKWTILSPPRDMNWFTSDSPVIRLNFFNPSRYDFKGGWDSNGTEILMPLSPKHLLYTKVGKRSPLLWGNPVPTSQARLIRRMIAEHAHRFIFSVDPDPDVPRLRPRVVSTDLFQSEREQWDAWHSEQSAAQSELGNDNGTE